MDPHVECTYKGRRVTLLYSMDVMFDAAERFGSAGEMLTAMSGDTRAAFDAVRWAFFRMAHEGELARREDGETPREEPEETAPGRRMRPGEFLAMRRACMDAITIGYRREEEDTDEDEDEGLRELREKKAGDEPSARSLHTAG